jgi:uncharacterized protein
MNSGRESVRVPTEALRMARYRDADWVDPRIEIRASPRCGNGSFAVAPISAREIVMVWGGIIGTHEDARLGLRIKRGTATAIAEDRVIGSRPDGPDEPSPAHYLNHSCDPNIWMLDEVTLAARRDITADQELTADYAMWEWDEASVKTWLCVCGSPLCRRTITGRDWRLPELQNRYRGHFSPFINARIERSRDQPSPASRSGRVRRRPPRRHLSSASAQPSVAILALLFVAKFIAQ